MTLIELERLCDEDAGLLAACSPKRIRALVAAAKALKGLIPLGWDDGTMNHMPGIKAARDALAGLREAGIEVET